MVASIENKMSLDSEEIRSPEKPIRSINQNAVYACFGVGLLAIGLIVYSLLSSTGGSKTNSATRVPSFAPANTDKLASLEQLPESYDSVYEKQPPAFEEAAEVQASRAAVAPTYRYEAAPERVVQADEKKLRYEEERMAAEKSAIQFSGSRPSESPPAQHGYAAAADGMVFNGKPSEQLSSKERFLRGDGVSGPRMIQAAASRYMVMQGTIVPAVLLTEINSDLPGQILAQVTTNIFDTKRGKYLLIPQGSKIVGEYNSSVSFGQKRAQIVWTRIILPNTNSIDLGRMPGVDSAGASGARGSVDQHLDQMAVSVLVTSLLGAGVGMAQGPTHLNSITPQQVLGQSVVQEVGRLGTKMAEKVLDIQPTIKVKSGTKINVFSTADILLERYH